MILLIANAWAVEAAGSTDPEAIGVALKAELERNAKDLSLPDAPELYHLRYHLLALEQVDVEAQFGAVVHRSTDPFNTLGVEVRLGGPELDNTGFGGWENGFASADLPDVLTDYAVRLDAWWTTDMAYKEAVEHFARKSAQFTPPDDYPGDYTLTGATTHDGGSAEVGDADALIALGTDLSSVFGSDGRPFEQAQVNVGHEAGYLWTLDTEGTDVKRPISETTLRAWAQLRADDGMLLSDHVLWTVRTPSELPDAATMKAQVTAMRDGLQARAVRKAWSEEYVGPVLFEDTAASDLQRYLLVPQLEGTPAEVPFDSWFGELGSAKDPVRVGRRVLPSGWTVDDDPQRNPGHPGAFTHDFEGTPAQAVDLVSDGIVRDLLMSRIPRKGMDGTNGHARSLPARRANARVTDLRVRPDKSLSLKKLRKKALKAAAAYGRDSVAVVRRLQEPAVLQAGSTDFFMMMDDGPSLPPPVEVVLLKADGTETVLRGAAFASVQRFVLRDILAAGPVVQTDHMAPYEGDYGFLGVTEGMPTRVSAPAVLVGEMELVASPGDPQQMPLLPPPDAK